MQEKMSRLPEFDEEEPREKDFRNYNRQLKQQLDPETGERVELLTKKQLEELRKKELRGP